jgi:hypothetical protein
MEKNQNKTVEHDGSVDEFLEKVATDMPNRVADTREVMAMMAEATGEPAKMWGSSIIGYGSYHYKYDSGREGDFMLIGLSPRKAQLSLYIMPGYGQFQERIDQLGKVKTGKSCVYIKKLEQIDKDVLRKLIEESVAYMREKYPDSE